MPKNIMVYKTRFTVAKALARAQLKLKNEGSYLGLLWYLLQPLFLFILLLSIFSSHFSSEIKHYPLYLLLGIILFNVFHTTTVEATEIMRAHRRVLSSISFPREAFIDALILKTLAIHLIEVGIFSITLALFEVSIEKILLYGAVLIPFTVFIYGISLLLASLSVYAPDIKNLWAFCILLLWFATPIFYMPSENSTLSFIWTINPLNFFISAARDFVIYARTPDVFVLVGMSLSTVSAFVVGSVVFNKLKHSLAERV